MFVGKPVGAFAWLDCGVEYCKLHILEPACNVAWVERAFAWDWDLIEFDGVEEEGSDDHEESLEGWEL